MWLFCAVIFGMRAKNGCEAGISIMSRAGFSVTGLGCENRIGNRAGNGISISMLLHKLISANWYK